MNFDQAVTLLQIAGFKVVKQVSQNKWNVSCKLAGLEFSRACYLIEVVQLAQSLKLRPDIE